MSKNNYDEERFRFVLYTAPIPRFVLEKMEYKLTHLVMDLENGLLSDIPYYKELSFRDGIIALTIVRKRLAKEEL